MIHYEMLADEHDIDLAIQDELSRPALARRRRIGRVVAALLAAWCVFWIVGELCRPRISWMLQPPDWLFVGCLAVILLIAIALLVFGGSWQAFTLRRLINRRRRNRASAYYPAPRAYDFSEEGVRIESAVGVSERPWNAFSQWSESPNFLVASGRQLTEGVLVRKADLDAGRLEVLRGYLSAIGEPRR